MGSGLMPERWDLEKERAFKTTTGEEIDIDEWTDRKDILWHGTTRIHLRSIREKGLVKATEPALGATKEYVDIADTVGVVALTDTQQNARFYALVTTVITHNLKSRDMLVVAVRRKNLNLDWLLKRQPSEEGVRAIPGHEYDYLMDIPPEDIEGFFVWDERRKTFVLLEEDY